MGDSGIILDAQAIISPVLAIAQPQHRILVVFNETVDDATFSEESSFMVKASNGNEAECTVLGASEDFPMLILACADNFDVYDAVGLSYTEEDNKLCESFAYDMTKNS